MAVADGHIDAETLYQTLFSSSESTNEKPAELRLIRYRADMSNTEQMDDINAIHRQYGAQVNEIRYKRIPGSQQVHVTLRVRINDAEEDALRRDLLATGASNIEVRLRMKRNYALLTIIVFLWGLNPVFAQWFLHQGMPAISLVTLRLFTFAAFTSALFFLWKYKIGKHYSRPERLTISSVPPAAGLFGMSLFNYLALTFIPPSIHLTILRLSGLLVPLLKSRRNSWITTATLLFLFVGLFCLFLILPTMPPAAGIGLSLLALISYTIYSLGTEQVMHAKKIAVRYPYFSFQLGIFLALGGLVLLMFQPISNLLSSLTLPAIGYILLCVCIPHLCYTILLQTTRFKNFTLILLLEVPIAIISEYVFLGTLLHPLAYAAILVAIACLFLHERLKPILLYSE